MSIRRRLMTRFIGMLAGAVVLIILLGSVATYWVVQKVNEVNLVDDFAVNGLDQLINTAEILPDNTIQYDPELLKQVDKNQGWLGFWMNKVTPLMNITHLPMFLLTINRGIDCILGKPEAVPLSDCHADPGEKREGIHLVIW